MKAKQTKSRAWSILGMTLLATQSAWAGPLPLDQLKMWLRETQARLYHNQRAITELKLQSTAAEKTVAGLSTIIRDGKTPDTAMNGDNAGGFELIGGVSSISELGNETALKKTHTKLADVRQNLAKALAERRLLMNDMEAIVVQIAAWKEMG